MRRATRATVGLVATAAVLLTACGGAGSDRAPVAAGTASPTPTAPSQATASPGGPGATPFVSPSPTESPRPSANRCQPRQFISARRGEIGQPHIWVLPTQVSEWGPACRGLRVGGECSIGWAGSYAAPGNEAYIRFVAWEHGATKPARTVDVGPVPGEGQFSSRTTRFAYLVGKTDQVRFYLALLSEAKVPIAESDTFVYTVGCGG